MVPTVRRSPLPRRNAPSQWLEVYSNSCPGQIKGPGFSGLAGAVGNRQARVAALGALDAGVRPLRSRAVGAEGALRTGRCDGARAILGGGIGSGTRAGDLLPNSGASDPGSRHLDRPFGVPEASELLQLVSSPGELTAGPTRSLRGRPAVRRLAPDRRSPGRKFRPGCHRCPGAIRRTRLAPTGPRRISSNRPGSLPCRR